MRPWLRHVLLVMLVLGALFFLCADQVGAQVPDHALPALAGSTELVDLRPWA